MPRNMNRHDDIRLVVDRLKYRVNAYNFIVIFLVIVVVSQHLMFSHKLNEIKRTIKKHNYEHLEQYVDLMADILNEQGLEIIALRSNITHYINSIVLNQNKRNRYNN